jgi:hypothetical protein
VRPPQDPGAGRGGNPGELSEQNAQNAGILVGVCGQGPLGLFYSRAPAAQQAHRKQGIEEIARIIAGLKSSSDKIACFAKFCHILKPRVQERALGVFDAALKAIAMIGEPMSPPDVARCVAELVPVVATKLAVLGDDEGEDGSALSLSKSTREFFLWLAAKEQWELIVPLLTQPLKHQNLWKIAVNQIKLLTEITVRLNRAKKRAITSVPGLSLPVIMGFLVPHIESPRPELRGPAIELLLGLKYCGANVDGYIGRLSTKARAEVERRAAAEEGD